MKPRSPAKGEFFIIEKAALAMVPKVGASAFAVYAALASFAESTQQTCYPSQATLAGITGFSAATVHRAIRTLQSHDMIAVEGRRRSNGTRGLNLYKLLALGDHTSPVTSGHGSHTSPVKVPDVTSDGSHTSPVTDKQEVGNNHKNFEPQEGTAPAALLLQLIDGWNELKDAGLVQSRAKRDPMSKAVLSGFKRLKNDSELRDCFEDIPGLLAAIRRATFCHRTGWFTLPKPFGRNRDGELIARKILDGGYSDGRSKNNRPGAGQKFGAESTYGDAGTM